MAVVLTFGAKVPVVKIGRMAGQFAKPRSAPTEIVGRGRAAVLPRRHRQRLRVHRRGAGARSRADAAGLHPVGGDAEPAARLQPGRLCRHQPRIHSWTLDFTAGQSGYEQYHKLANRISDALEFVGAAGVSPETADALHRVDFYTSHEALLLEYEEALCRIDSTTGVPVAGSGHMIWIGDRTRQPDGAHVEFARGVQNPIGLKCGPTITDSDLLKLADRLNPRNEAGRLTLICRFGAGQVAEHLPRLIRAIEREGRKVVWSCDPMHGNTIKSASGYKTRPFERVLREVREFFAVHEAEGTIPGGVHFEMTGKDVTECTGGVRAVTDENLSDRYHTACDPRLNAAQALELAFLVAEMLHQRLQARRAAV